MKNKIAVIVLFLSAIVLISAKVDKKIGGKVIGVTDGDTITVLDNSFQNFGKVQYKIRLGSIDAPERGQAFGTKSKEVLSDKIFQKNIIVQWETKDKYGRIIGNIFIDDRLINKEMIEEGWAWHYKKYSNSKELSDAEEKAKSNKLGLWAGKNPIAPWDFRHESFVEREVERDNSSKSFVEAKKDNLKGDTDKSVVVYVTNSGMKYHLGDCRYLVKSKISMSLIEAKRKYEPCSVCNPPR